MDRPQTTPTAEKAATVAEVSALIGLNVKTVYDAVNRGEIPVVQVGRRKLIPRAWLKSKFGDAE